MADYDVLGNIAVIKSEINGKQKTKKQKLREARELLEKPNIKTILEKVGNIKGRLRTINVKHVLGEKNLIVKHKENGCMLKFNIKTCYFSPRLAEERKEISEKIRIKDRVLVMFAGVGVYPIVIWKIAKPKEIVAIELGRECCRYFKENLKLNKISENKIKIIQGDVKKKINKKIGNFDVIVMPRPNLKESFLKQALKVSKKGTRIYYYGFCHEDEKKKMIGEIYKESKKARKKIKILKIKKAGDIAPYKYRWRIEIAVK